jgi:hypothetical protein
MAMACMVVTGRHRRRQPATLAPILFCKLKQAATTAVARTAAGETKMPPLDRKVGFFYFSLASVGKLFWYNTSFFFNKYEPFYKLKVVYLYRKLSNYI